METVIRYVLAIFGSSGFILLIIFLNPQKAEIWASIFWKLLRTFFKKAEKKYIQHDIQGRINDYNRILGKEVKNYEPTGIKISWIEESERQTSFFKDNAIIIRLRKSENQNRNFVFASLTFISQVVLKKAKRYISPSQKESIDLYVAKKLFAKEKPEVIDQFVNDFLIPKTENNKKVSEYFDKYSLIDKVGLFWPVFIQELIFLGNKVFGKRREDIIVTEVNGLVEFLKTYSERELGDQKNKLTFNGRYCRFGIMIVAKSSKVRTGDLKPYLKYMLKLLNVGIENIYIIGSSQQNNEAFMRNICLAAEAELNVQCFYEKEYSAHIMIQGKRTKCDNLLIIVRRKDLQYHYDSEDQAKLSK